MSFRENDKKKMNAIQTKQKKLLLLEITFKAKKKTSKSNVKTCHEKKEKTKNEKIKFCLYKRLFETEWKKI